MTIFSVEELPVPDRIDDDDAADFIETIEVRNSIEAASYGTHELTMTAAETLPYWLDREHSPRRLFGVRLDGRIVGRAYYEKSVADGDQVAWSTVEVLPEFRGRGIGTAMADTVERLARDDARARLLVYVVSPDGPGERLTAATGFGSVPLRNPEVRFCSPVATPSNRSSEAAGSRCPSTPTCCAGGSPRPPPAQAPTTRCTPGPAGCRNAGGRTWRRCIPG